MKGVHMAQDSKDAFEKTSLGAQNKAYDIIAKLDPEYFEIPAETADRIRAARETRGRIIAVGTSATRALESAVHPDGRVDPSGTTDLFIYPGYAFGTVRGLLTNFHMPESTLLMLVSALTGIENLKTAYSEALRLKYRFLSFGDAMLIL